MKFIIDNIFLIILALSSGGALVWHTLQRSGDKVSALQATQLINREKGLILDVRSAEEFATGHIREAKNIPLKELNDRVGELDKAKNRPVIIVCAKGLQSNKAAAQLKKAGFSQAYPLVGGIAEWQSQDLPLVK